VRKVYKLNVNHHSTSFEERSRLQSFLKGLGDNVTLLTTTDMVAFEWLGLKSEYGADELEGVLRASGFEADVFDALQHQEQEKKHDHAT